MFYLQNAVLYKTLSYAESLSGCTYILTFIHNSSSTARKKDWDTVETSIMTICWNDDMQPAKHKCHACCQQQATGGWIKSVVDYTHDTRVERFVSTFQKIPQMFVTCSEHYYGCTGLYCYFEYYVSYYAAAPLIGCYFAQMHDCRYFISALARRLRRYCDNYVLRKRLKYALKYFYYGI